MLAQVQPRLCHALCHFIDAHLLHGQLALTWINKRLVRDKSPKWRWSFLLAGEGYTLINLAVQTNTGQNFPVVFLLLANAQLEAEDYFLSAQPHRNA